METENSHQKKQKGTGLLAFLRKRSLSFDTLCIAASFWLFANGTGELKRDFGRPHDPIPWSESAVTTVLQEAAQFEAEHRRHPDEPAEEMNKAEPLAKEKPAIGTPAPTPSPNNFR